MESLETKTLYALVMRINRLIVDDRFICDEQRWAALLESDEYKRADELALTGSIKEDKKCPTVK